MDLVLSVTGTLANPGDSQNRALANMPTVNKFNKYRNWLNDPFYRDITYLKTLGTVLDDNGELASRAR